MRLLLLNPNTSAHITARLAASARAALHADDELQALTGRDGPAAVRDETTLRSAERETLRLADAHAGDADALLLGLSLDGVVEELRSRLAPRPAIGMTEAAVWTACQLGRRLGLLTLGAAVLPLYRERLLGLVAPSRIAALEAPEAPLAFTAGAAGVAPEVLPVLLDAARRLRAAGADSIVLAGAVLCGYERALEAELGVPVLDGVACAVQQAHALAALRPRASATPAITGG